MRFQAPFRVVAVAHDPETGTISVGLRGRNGSGVAEIAIDPEQVKAFPLGALFHVELHPSYILPGEVAVSVQLRGATIPDVSFDEKLGGTDPE